MTDAGYSGDVAEWVVALSEPIISELGSGLGAPGRSRSGAGGGAASGSITAKVPDRDTLHDLVDLALDRVLSARRFVHGTLLRGAVDELRRVVIQRAGAWGAGAAGSAGAGLVAAVPSLRADSVLPGELRRLSLVAENTSAVPLVGLRFSVTDLVAAAPASGAVVAVTVDPLVLAATTVAFDPDLVDVEAHGSMPIGLSVDVPRTARPGVYSGLVAASGLPAVAVLTVVVV